MARVRSMLLVAVALLLPPARSPAADDAVPLEVLLSAPLYSAMSASPDGSRFAWVENRRGARNVWVASGDPLAPAQVTRFTEDDGQELSQLSFSRDGSVLAFVRGGPPSFDKVAPDPATTALGTKVEIWLWRAGADAALFGLGSAPDVSPEGERIAFIREGKIFIGSTREPDKAAAAVAVRGRLLWLRWSPDGVRVAFVSGRSTHALVGVYATDAKSVVWMAPGFANDIAPAWSPDSTRIAFLRMPPEPAQPTLDIWETPGRLEILVADVASGKTRVAFRSSDRTAGHAQYTDQRPLQWAAGDLLVFPWEHENWARLYAVPVAGGAASALSPPGCEARTPQLDSKRERLFYLANCGDVDRSHVWSVSVTGGEPRAVTIGKGIESGLAVGNRQILFFAATALQPALPTVLDAQTGAMRALASAEAGWPASRLVEPEPVVFRARDGMGIHGQLFRRADVPGRRPAIIFVHGGPIRQMLLGWSPFDPNGYYPHTYAMNQHLASKGNLVLSVNYRNGTGYGRAFRLPPRRAAQGASEYQDVVAAARYLRSRPDVDPSRIAIWGGSYGGYLTAMALARDPDLFAAGVDFHGVHDWSAWLRTGAPAEWNWPPADMRLAVASSPIASLARWRAPVLIVHGDHDPNVRISQSLDLIERLEALPRPPEVEPLLVPDEIHFFLRHATWLNVLGRASDFFDRRLRTPAHASVE